MRSLWPAVLVALVAGACGSDDAGSGGQPTTATRPEVPDGAPAVWAIDEARPPSPTHATFVVLVTRVECNSGRTGEVLEPTVTEEAEDIVITFSVAPTPPGDHDCQGNDAVASTITLERPLGERRLLDGACLAGSAPAGLCEVGPVRWPEQG
jgi:hypothetical protein